MRNLLLVYWILVFSKLESHTHFKPGQGRWRMFLLVYVNTCFPNQKIVHTWNWPWDIVEEAWGTSCWFMWILIAATNNLEWNLPIKMIKRCRQNCIIIIQYIIAFTQLWWLKLWWQWISRVRYPGSVISGEGGFRGGGFSGWGVHGYIMVLIGWHEAIVCRHQVSCVNIVSWRPHTFPPLVHLILQLRPQLLTQHSPSSSGSALHPLAFAVVVSGAPLLHLMNQSLHKF